LGAILAAIVHRVDVAIDATRFDRQARFGASYSTGMSS
jgi:hypothetical protein